VNFETPYTIIITIIIAIIIIIIIIGRLSEEINFLPVTGIVD